MGQRFLTFVRSRKTVRDAKNANDGYRGGEMRLSPTAVRGGAEAPRLQDDSSERLARVRHALAGAYTARRSPMVRGRAMA